MRAPALATAILVVVASGAGGCKASAPDSTPPSPTRTAADLSRERAWIEEARAALGDSAHETARARAQEAVTALLARPTSEQDEAWAALIDSAAHAAWESMDPRTARAAWEAALEFRSRTLPPEHVGILGLRGNVGLTLRSMGELLAARALQEELVEIGSRTLPPEHPTLLIARQNLAVVLLDLGEYAASRALQEQVLEVFARTLPADDRQLQRVRTSLANVLDLQGELAAARALREQVVEVYSRTLPPEHRDLGAARTRLAATLYSQGHLAAARELQDLVLEVYSRTEAPDFPPRLTAQINLGLTLHAQGDLSAARALQEQTLDALRARPPDDLALQAARLNLANTLIDQGETGPARELQELVVESLSRTLPPDHPDLQTARANLANSLKDAGEFSAALVLQDQVLEVRSRTLPPDHPDLQMARINLANTLKSQGDPAAACVLYGEVLDVRARTLPSEHAILQAARLNLANALAHSVADAGEGGAMEAEARCVELMTSHARAATQTARTAVLSSTREAEERCASLQHAVSVSLSFASGYGALHPDPPLARAAFVLSETARASGLSAARVARSARSDERYGPWMEEFRSAGAELARLVQTGATRDAYDEVIARRDRAQQALVELASGPRQGPSPLEEPDPAVLSERLGDRDAIVAYRRYTRWAVTPGQPKEWLTDSLCAFVLRKGQELRLVELGNMAPIQAGAADWRESLGVAEGRGVGAAREDGDLRVEMEHARRLAALVFDPLLPSLGDARRLVLVLDDVLQGVPIDALPLGEDPSAAAVERIGDRFEVEVRGTLQELMSSDAPPTGGSLVVAVGGADYAAGQGIGGAPAVPGVLRGGAWEDGFTALPATLEEARGLGRLASEGDAAREIVLLEGTAASRGAVEELAPRARFLHLATHGWFAPESVRSWSDPEPLEEGGRIPRIDSTERVKGSSPMTLCGLALAGANSPADAVEGHPGLVTAEEISGWDLTNCELAVLSACDTARGELRRAGQGVASLQKALHMAGARSVVTSLWKVPDDATKGLMLDFYRRIWIEKMPKARALWEAKRRLREAVDESGRPEYATRDWAAWVLTGEPD